MIKATYCIYIYCVFCQLLESISVETSTYSLFKRLTKKTLLKALQISFTVLIYSNCMFPCQKSKTVLVSCRDGTVLEVEAPQPGNNDTSKSYYLPLSNLKITEFQFRSIKEKLRVSLGLYCPLQIRIVSSELKCLRETEQIM